MRDLYSLLRKHRARRLYLLYLGILLQDGRERLLLQTTKKLRRLAKKHNDPRLSSATYSFEIAALCNLREFHAAWRRLRVVERLALGHQIDLSAGTWNAKELAWFMSYHVQLLYFIGRYKTAASLLEAALADRIKHRRKAVGEELLPYIYSLVRTPRECHQVTLSHIYERLGKSLSEWKQWHVFVRDLGSRPLQASHTSRDELLQKPSVLRRLIGHGRRQVVSQSANESKNTQHSQIIRELTGFFPELGQK